MGKITFLNPEFFLLFLLIPIAIAWLFLKRNHQSATLKISSIQGFKDSNSLLAKLKPILNILRLLALSSLILAIARPRTVDVSNRSKTTRGIDIVMAVDVSGSMLSRDLKPNRKKDQTTESG
jgi:Ca-activated chloride channel homolog